MTHRRPSRVFYAIYTSAIVFGAAIISWEAFQLHRQKASFQWPTASGTIVECSRVLVGGRDAHYRVDCTYNYKVNGTSYVSHRISLFSRDLSSYDSINEPFVANHPAGTAVDVYYKPTDPSNAVLIPGPDETSNKFAIGAMAVAMVIAILGIIRRIPRDRRLAALLNAPDAATRTMHLRASDIQKGMHTFMCYAVLAFFLSLLSVVLLLGPWLQHPAVLLEASHPMDRRLLIWGIGSLVAAVLLLILAIKKGRPAECPLCGSLLNQVKASNPICPDCRTRIIFDDQNPPASALTKV
jgi:hypothetical protein